MTVQVNGKPVSVPDDATVAALVEQQGLKDIRVAVEVNLELVVKKQWADTRLKAGDRIEIVSFKGGG